MKIDVMLSNNIIKKHVNVKGNYPKNKPLKKSIADSFTFWRVIIGMNKWK